MSVEVRSVARYVRMSAHKVRLVVDLVRGRGVADALNILRFTPKAAAKVVSKVIASAAANAEETHGLAADDLYIARIMADEGPTLRRGRAGARGRYKPLLKRSAHVTVVLAERSAAAEATESAEA
jgi:large subunit ribosomal protein L22